MNKFSYIFILACVSFTHSELAFGFQEQSTIDIQTTRQTKIQDETQSTAEKTELSPEKSVNTSLGTEVYIPGLGKLGMIPKMDFGLELLYGSKDDKYLTQPNDDLNLNDNLRIRGSLKHNF